jgi:hypothetical protein
LDGPQGYALAISNAQGTYYRYIKLWQLNQEELKAKANYSKKADL